MSPIYVAKAWSVCRVNETAKQTAASKSIFVQSFLEKENQWLMIDILYEYY